MEEEVEATTDGTRRTAPHTAIVWIVPYENTHVIDHKFVREIWHRYQAHLAMWRRRSDPILLSVCTTSQFMLNAIDALTYDRDADNTDGAPTPNNWAIPEVHRSKRLDDRTRTTATEMRDSWNARHFTSDDNEATKSDDGGDSSEESGDGSDTTEGRTSEMCDSWISRYYLDLYEWGREK